jgi:phage FluMu gp28-like protein
MTDEFFRIGRFLDYQKKWLAEPSLYKFGLWARQTGKDYTCAAEAAYDCATNEDRHWLIVACGERQARESLLKAKEWARLLEEQDAKPTPYSAVRRESSTEILFENNSRITALPAKPETIRGYSANVILTEFAFHDDPEAIWKAIFPSVSNPMRGGPKKLRIISTPNGQGNFFHRLWTDSPIFYRQRLTIHEARDQGLNVDIDTLKQGILDPESWAQEYECHFLDHTSVLLPYELIEQCESPDATETCSGDGFSVYKGELFAGIDFGRKQDLTVCWILERFGGELWTREVLTLHRSPTPAQLEALRPRVRRARRVCVDYTGAGIGLGDLLGDEFGIAKHPGDPAGKMEPCTFTAALKEEIMVKLRAAFERRKIWIPRSNEIREDLHAVHRVISSSGHISYRASHSADGHSDRCTALALALRAAESTPAIACASTVGTRFRSVRR